MMDNSFSDRLAEVPGWFDTSLLPVYSRLNDLQQRLSLSGNICEIGVHHGKSFLPLCQIAGPKETVLAIDPFDECRSHIDWQNSKNSFMHFIDSFLVNRSNVELIQKRSDSLSLHELADHAPFRIFSIDGEHTAESTCHDLELAYATLAPGGVIILDDVLRKKWRTVTEGLQNFFEKRRPNLLPFFAGYNKVFYAPREFAGIYRDCLGDPIDDSVLQSIPPYAARVEDSAWLGEHFTQNNAQS